MLADFHPTIAHRFADTLGTPSQPQQQGWPRIRQGGHVLIVAQRMIAFLRRFLDWPRHLQQDLETAWKS